MRIIKPLWGLLLACVWLPSNVLAEDYSTVSVAKMPDRGTQPIRQQQGVSSIVMCDHGEILEKKADFQRVHGIRAKADADVSIDDIAGEWVQTYKTLVSTSADGGKSVTISVTDAATGSIKIENFFDAGVVVSATVDMAAKTISIPNQEIFESATVGKLDIAVVVIGSDNSVTPDRSKNIEGVINSDGSITLVSDWGIFGMEGDNANKFAGLFYDTQFEKANARMSQTRLINTTNPFSYEETTYNVIAEQTATNIVTVKNFGNWGMTVDIELKRDNTSVINQQVVRREANGDNYYISGITYDPSSGRPTSYTGNVLTEKATDNRTISWKDWTMTNSGSYLAVITEGKLTVPFDINYPTSSVSDFEGEGTESSPYLIRSLDHLILLSEKVNDVAESDYNSTIVENGKEQKYNKAFAGQYFQLANDIYMGNYRFTPIGKDWYHHFSGVFDGNGHIIIDLEISTGGAGYAALFGRLSGESEVKNLTVVNPVVRTANYYAGAIAGWSDGLLENCHVVGADVQNSGRATGGLAAIAEIIRNCTIERSKVIGLGGNVGGLVSEVDNLMDGCSATEMDVIAFAPAETFPAGGLVGSLYYGKAKNSYFSGTVDSQILGASGMRVGGVSGTCYHGSIENCFSVGQILGNGLNTAAGGLTGALYGSISDSYSSGVVSGWQSSNVGGLSGLVDSYKEEGDETVFQSSVKGCYTVSQVVSNSYLYDIETGARETIGSVADGAEPTIENVYFDKQYSNYGSKNRGLTSMELTAASGVAGLDASKWIFTEGYYPRLKGMDSNSAAEMGASVIMMAEGNSLGKLSKEASLSPLGDTEYYLLRNNQYGKEGAYSSIADGKLSIKDDFGVDTLVVKNGEATIAYTLKITPVPFDGEGTATNPFLLKTKDDLLTLSSITNEKSQYFTDTYFKLANDIDMEYAPFESIAGHYNDVNVAFAGTIDGDGHTIHKLEINRVVWKIKPEDSADGLGTPETSLGNDPAKNSRMTGGFIGRLAAEGVVKNLNFADDCKFTMWSMSGAVVGDCYGTVENCRNYADITGYSSNIGGIVGQLRKDGRVVGCYNAGDIYCGYNNAGGVVATSYGYVENCANAGSVIVKKLSKQSTIQKMIKSAGGVVAYGNGTVLRNCLNVGSVYAWGDRVGGIAAYFSKISHELGSSNNEMYNSINYGAVKSDYTDESTVNAIVGEGVTEGAVANNYWDFQILPLKASGNSDKEGMTGVETSELISGKPLTGFDVELWDFAEGQYPVLKSFANEDKMVKARKVIVEMKPGVTAKDMSKNAKLAILDGLKWSLEKGDNFALAGSNLYSPEEVDDLVTDVLVADFGDYKKEIEIKRAPAIPLAGTGTSEDPYLISSVDDWNNLSDYMDLVSESFESKFLKITSDLNFTDKEFKMLCAAGVTPFNGTLDGDGKTMSGISINTTGTYQAAIRTVGELGTVANLTMEGEVTSAQDYTGGFSAKVYGTLTNCVSKINVVSTKKTRTSGFGYLYSTAKLTEVVNKGNITGAGNYIAGIASKADEGVSLVKCGNEGTILCNAKQISYAAGLIAEANPVTMVECYNKGNIETIDIEKTKSVAGLIAYASAKTGRKIEMTLDKCYNEGNITGSIIVGGLIANTDANASSLTNPMTLSECYNTGNITVMPEKPQSGNSAPVAGLVALYTPGSQFLDCYNAGEIKAATANAGGIAGYPKANAKEDLQTLFKGCRNTGNIVGTSNHVGGIVALNANYTVIDNGYNAAEVKGNYGVGGIAGNIDGEFSVIKNSYNTGSVTAATNRAGGIVGLGFKGNLESCLNIGNVASESTEVGDAKTSGYGIGGIAGLGTSIYTNCYNLGSVMGANRVGGLVGYPKSGQTQILSCYNMGSVAGTEEIGSIIGADITDTSIWNSETNKVEGSYFTTESGSNNTVGTAISVGELAKLDMGDGWTSGDDYTLPIPTTLIANPYALINAVTVAFADGDTENKVTKNFFVGAPEGVVWSSSVGNISFSGFNAEFSAEAFEGTAILTATAGELSKTFEINCDKEDAGIYSVVTGKNIVDEKWFNASGVRVVKPTFADGAVYVVVVTYDDGSESTIKVFNTK